MKVLVFGASGQLGRELSDRSNSQYEIVGKTRSAVDITDPEAVRRCIATESPDVIVNAAAYTAVDQAESHRDLAWSVNSDGALCVARAAENARVRVVHVSTDFVFDGQQSRPYRTSDPVNPLNTYGESKAAAEGALLAIDSQRIAIVRTSWLYRPGHANFVTTMLRLMVSGRSLSVVVDQIGSPTSSETLADAIIRICEHWPKPSIYHVADRGVASWYDFAKAIATIASRHGVFATPPRVTPIRSVAYPTPARRPSFSVLDTAETEAILGIEFPYWRDALEKAMVGFVRHV